MGGYLDKLSADPDERREFLLDHARIGSRDEANRFRAALIAKYGPDRGAAVQYAEAFEISEYAAPVDEKQRQARFPF
jgi:hypothetical protein